MGRSCSEEQHVIPFTWEARLASSFPQHTLASVSEHRISKSLRRNEGDSCRAAFVASQYCHADKPVIGSLAVREDPPKLLLGLDGLHAKLDGQPLAALGATTRDDVTAALGGHAGAEAVGLSALALVRLVRTLHNDNLQKEIFTSNKQNQATRL